MKDVWVIPEADGCGASMGVGACDGTMDLAGDRAISAEAEPVSCKAVRDKARL